MHYKLIIIDKNIWMYTDMAHQTMTKLTEEGHTSDIVDYEIGENTDSVKYVFFGTGYNAVKVPHGSIVTNFDNDTLVFSILTPEIIETCTIWDYSKENICLIKEKYPNADCHFFEMGYSPHLDHGLSYNECEKDIDVLFLGGKTNKRQKILNEISQAGYNVMSIYRKNGPERADFFRRAKIIISIYSSEHTHCISASRFTPALCNNGFIITENCSNSEQNERWSQYTVSVEYEKLVSTVLEYLEQPEKRKELADDFYVKFKLTRPRVY